VISLTSPTGVTRTLVNRRGGSGHNFATTTLDDHAATSLATGRAPFNGPFRPEQSLAVFNGLNARGTWTLRVSDVAPMDTGRVNSATLSIAGTPSGQRKLALPLRSYAVTPPAPAMVSAAEDKAPLPVLHGVWIASDDVPGATKPEKQPVTMTPTNSLPPVARFAGRRAEFDGPVRHA
jgi:hypothetical protein